MIQLTETQLQTFRDVGIVRLPGFIPAGLVDPAREQVYQRLENGGFWRGDRWVTPEDPAAGRKRLKRALKNCARSRTFENLLVPEAFRIAEQLCEHRQVQPTSPRTQLLFTPPGAPRWTVPHSIWHLDVPRLGDLEPPGVQLFTFLDRVEPGGGGTLLVAGSHRLENDAGILGSKEVKRRLKRHDYFRDLMDKNVPDRSRFITEIALLDNVSLQVTELTGSPGDAYFTDLRLLHSLGPNASERPRLMVTQRLPRVSAAARMSAIHQALAESRQRALR
jgi:ectoine hydroxylase-related dioxygenase (phytanoyl-CoA dioxygenase family)